MSSNSNLLQATLPSVGKPKWRRTFHIEDIKPRSTSQIPSSSSPIPTKQQPVPAHRKHSLIQIVDDPTEKLKQSDTSLHSFVCCPICNQNETRYTCPKCSTPFCSVECYRIHDLPPPSSSSSQTNRRKENSNPFSGGSCTERFYQNKVNEICHLDVRDESNRSQMNDILTRSFYDTNGGHQLIEETNDKPSHGSNNLSEGELVELATHVLSLKDLNDDEYDDETNVNDQAYEVGIANLDSIPQYLLLKFEQAVQRGDLTHLVNQWHPYWLPDHQTIARGSVDNIERNDEVSAKVETLDERILSIPDLLKSSSKHIELQFNICEVLYQTAYVLRLYNGCIKSGIEISDQNDVILESASFLYSQSNSLYKNKIYTSLNEVFMDCTVKGGDMLNKNNMYQIRTNNGIIKIDWKVLLNDMTYICQNKRLVLHVLFDAMDILKAGIQSLKKMKSNRNCFGDHNIELGESKKQWKLAKKKLEYYTSWIMINWVPIQHGLATDVKEWLNDWILHEGDRDIIRDATIIGNIHVSTGSREDDTRRRNRDAIQSESILKPISTKFLSKDKP